MTLKQSEALRKRWASVPQEKRSKIMSKVAIAKHEAMTPAEKTKQALIMRSGHGNKMKV